MENLGRLRPRNTSMCGFASCVQAPCSTLVMLLHSRCRPAGLSVNQSARALIVARHFITSSMASRRIRSASIGSGPQITQAHRGCLRPIMPPEDSRDTRPRSQGGAAGVWRRRRVLRKLIALRKCDQGNLAEEETLLQFCRHALGMA